MIQKNILKLLLTIIISIHLSCSNGEVLYSSMSGEASYRYFVYVTNVTSNTVTAFESETSNGLLKSVGDYTIGGSAVSITAAPNGEFLYIATAATLYGFRIDRTFGTLTTLSGFPTTYPTSFRSIKVSANGEYLFTSNTVGSAVSYTIDRATGAINAKSTVTSGASGGEVAVDPFSRFVYFVDNNSQVYSYKINSDATLSAAPGSPLNGTAPFGIAAGADGQYVFTSSSGNGAITVYSLNQSTGALTVEASKGLTAYGGAGTFHLAASASGKYLFATNNTGVNKCLGVMDISNGSLSHTLSSSFSIGNGTCEGIAADPVRDFVFFADNNASGKVHGYSPIDRGAIFGNPFNAQVGPNRVTVVAIPK